MILITHPFDLNSLQQYLLTSYLYFELIGEYEAAETYGNKFDNIYKYK